MQLECFPTIGRPPELVPARPERKWMDEFTNRHPYRCLPMTMANSTGWELLCPVGFTATWNGGLAQTDITLRPDHPFPDFVHFASSHFSHGVITLHPGWVRTDMGGPNADVEVAASVAGMRRVIAEPAAYPSGGFYDYRGQPLAW